MKTIIRKIIRRKIILERKIKFWAKTFTKYKLLSNNVDEKMLTKLNQ